MKLDLYLLTQKSTTNGQRFQYETQNTETEWSINRQYLHDTGLGKESLNKAPFPQKLRPIFDK